MSNLYNRIEDLCYAQNINITEMCRQTGTPRGSLTDLKMGRISILSANNLSKIASYFGVSMDSLLGTNSEGAVYGTELELILQKVSTKFNVPISEIKSVFSSGLYKTDDLNVLDEDNLMNFFCRLYENSPNRPPSITFDDFSYAMHNEGQKLTEGDKSLLLQMAKQLSEKNQASGKTD